MSGENAPAQVREVAGQCTWITWPGRGRFWGRERVIPPSEDFWGAPQKAPSNCQLGSQEAFTDRGLGRRGSWGVVHEAPWPARSLAVLARARRAAACLESAREAAG